MDVRAGWKFLVGFEDHTIQDSVQDTYYVIHLPALIPGSLPFASQVTMSLRGETRRQNKESLGSRLFSHLLIAPPPPIPLLPSPGLPKKLTPIVKNSQGTPTLSKQPPVADLEGGLGAQLPLLWVKKKKKIFEEIKASRGSKTKLHPLLSPLAKGLELPLATSHFLKGWLLIWVYLYYYFFNL